MSASWLHFHPFNPKPFKNHMCILLAFVYAFLYFVIVVIPSYSCVAVLKVWLPAVTIDDP